MKSLLVRMLGAVVMSALTVGPISAATVPGGSTMVAQQTSASITGTVVDDTGVPIADVSITLSGPNSYHTQTDVHGAFTIADVAPGVYRLDAIRAGYDRATEADYPVVAGQPATVAITMHRATLTSLHTIARVRAVSRATFNTSTSSLNVVPSAVFADQGNPQVTRVLNQVPGVQVAFPSTSGAQASSPGAISFVTIRGAAAFETASLIDGHPLSVGQYGDYVTTFLNSSAFGSTEVIKGPGAMSPEVNYAIGGTVNFRTKDPTATADPWYTFNITNHGGTFADLGLSDTVLNGRLGFVVDYSRNYDQAAFNGQQVCFDPSGNTIGATKLNGWNGSNLKTTIPGTVSNLQTKFPLLACGEALTGDLDANSELLKLRYKFSGATTATVSYLGGQAYADQNANTGSLTALSQFAPGAGYSGGIAAGAYPEYYLHPGGPDRETNNEPILQAEVSTTIGNDTVLARFYHASIDRLVDEGNAGANAVETLPLYGTSCSSVNFKTNGCSGTVTNFNGSPVAISFNNYYRQAELDKLGGVSFQYVHPIGDNTLTFSVDQTRSSTTAYSVSSFTNVSIPTGSNQKFTTAMLRGDFELGTKTNGILSLYDNSYQSTYPVSCPFSGSFNSCAIDGSNVTFGTTTNGHFDARLGLTYRPKEDTSIRFAMGSAIAPPYLALLSQITTPYVSYNQNAGQATQVVNNGGLKPETAFGYDLGADHIFKDHVTTLSADVYMTNLFNHFFNQTFATSSVCGVNFTCKVTNGVAPPVGTPVFQSSNINLSNARFEGIELTLRHTPSVGFGWQLTGSTQKGYVYNLPAYFYCSNPGVGCTQNQNLNILPNTNFCGAGIAAGGLSTGTGNVCMPYLQGDAQLSYRFKNGAFILGGETLYGKGNSLNEPPFGIGYLSIQYPLNKTVAIQVSGDNIFNAWSNDFELYGGGVPVPLVNGSLAATSGNVLGPATWRFGIRKALGANPADFNNP